jgi:hypothetical protein
LSTDTDALVERWIIAFCEPPVLIDPGLMRRVLAEVEATAGKADGTCSVGQASRGEDV